MKLIFVLPIALLYLSCTGKISRSIDQNHGGSMIKDANSNPHSASQPLPESHKTKVETVQATFSAPYGGGSVRFLSATPLVTVLKRIDSSFSESDFSPLEKVKLQEFCYHNDDSCQTNMRHKVPPSLDYFKVLRKGAATACERLLKAEWADQDNDKNILVRKNDPTEESISKFMSKIFYGDIDIPGKVEGADKLKKAYTEYIRVTKGKKDKVKQDAYLLLCVAASTDVRSFTR